MKVLIVGAGGQLGRCLVEMAPRSLQVEARTRAELDIENDAQIASVLRSVGPSVVINACAYTAVDLAETERERAFAVNELGVAKLASLCRELPAKLIHVSTDYVFDGNAAVAYEPTADPRPVNLYGASKLAGEHRIQQVTDLASIIVRTAWVYAPHGKNFLRTMLRLMRERGQVSVVADQIGTPTSAMTLARFLWQCALASDVRGCLHYTDAGVASWYDFAVAIQEEAVARGLVPANTVVKPISTSQFPTAARRPAMSLLATRSSLERVPMPQPHWRVALREVLAKIRSDSID